MSSASEETRSRSTSATSGETRGPGRPAEEVCAKCASTDDRKKRVCLPFYQRKCILVVRYCTLLFSLGLAPALPLPATMPQAYGSESFAKDERFQNLCQFDQESAYRKGKMHSLQNCVLNTSTHVLCFSAPNSSNRSEQIGRAHV